MKKYLYLILVPVLLSVQTDKKSLLCHKWIQFAFKANKEATSHKVGGAKAKECEFKSNGSYEESMYNNQFKMSGNWYLNPEQTKFELTTTTINGQSVPVAVDPTRYYNHIILKLTNDTLIYGNETYSGKDFVYGHDDWYFVRKK